jgi:exopolysaccharide biosynthesis polyprenyl glycosylphosphotransferase
MLSGRTTIMKSNISFIYTIFLALGDFLALVTAFVVAYILRVTLSDVPIAYHVGAWEYLRAFLTLLPLWILIFALLGLYNGNIYEKRFTEFGRLLVGSFVGLSFIIFYDFLTLAPLFPAKLVPIYGFALAFILLVIFRNLARSIRTLLFSFDIGITHILIVGNTAISDELRESLHNSRRSGYRVLGVVGDGRRRHHADYDSFTQALEAIKDKPLHAIFQTELYPQEEHNRQILDYAQQHHISYRFIPGNTELFVGNIDVELFRSGVPVIAVHQTPLLGWGRLVKRVFDILVSGLALIITSPLFIIIALLNAMLSGGVFFHHTRLTRFNHKFELYKFRTQYTKYDGTTPEQAFDMMGKPELAKKYRENGDSLDNDPRITPFGRFLRASSLDELPQLINILKGDLSLVGPRALIPEEMSKFEKRHTILSVKSGLTGLAVVSGRRDIPFEERRKLDMYYVQNWSFWLDLTILAKTARVLISRSGAR